MKQLFQYSLLDIPEGVRNSKTLQNTRSPNSFILCSLCVVTISPIQIQTYTCSCHL